MVYRQRVKGDRLLAKLTGQQTAKSILIPSGGFILYDRCRAVSFVPGADGKASAVCCTRNGKDQTEPRACRDFECGRRPGRHWPSVGAAHRRSRSTQGCSIATRPLQTTRELEITRPRRRAEQLFVQVTPVTAEPFSLTRKARLLRDHTSRPVHLCDDNTGTRHQWSGSAWQDECHEGG